jgi:hypothetical protein
MGMPMIGNKKHKGIPIIKSKHPIACFEFCSLFIVFLFGLPQFGQAFASEDIWCPQSLHVINGIFVTPN